MRKTLIFGVAAMSFAAAGAVAQTTYSTTTTYAPNSTSTVHKKVHTYGNGVSVTKKTTYHDTDGVESRTRTTRVVNPTPGVPGDIVTKKTTTTTY